MIPEVMDKPNPLPLSSSLVVKKGSKILDRYFFGIPHPLSLKVMVIFTMMELIRELMMMKMTLV